MKKTPLVTLILISSIAFSGCSLFPQINKTNVPETTKVMEETSVNSPTTDSVFKEGKYVEYTPTIISESAQQGKKVVLFFHAKWCPTCKAAQEDIVSRLDELADDIVIVRVDYDTYDDLKKKYSITYQHTFVQVDGDGNEITTWNGGDIDEIKSNVKLSFCDPMNKNSC